MEVQLLNRLKVMEEWIHPIPCQDQPYYDNPFQTVPLLVGLLIHRLLPKCLLPRAQIFKYPSHFPQLVHYLLPIQERSYMFPTCPTEFDGKISKIFLEKQAQYFEQMSVLLQTIDREDLEQYSCHQRTMQYEHVTCFEALIGKEGHWMSRLIEVEHCSESVVWQLLFLVSLLLPPWQCLATLLRRLLLWVIYRLFPTNSNYRHQCLIKQVSYPRVYRQRCTLF